MVSKLGGVVVGYPREEGGRVSHGGTPTYPMMHVMYLPLKRMTDRHL